ncbi:DUF305 domain-containing protein [Sphingobium sp. CFD-1]|uniref:DUF305 domain-containing protein n=1 Tax=Sphingobium sp. CFD-1 TaxID=2878545 RepID=UPI00214BD843|nr:DUF305 domain-containing protein [Sphingobium sp. CFD-1]
MKAVTLAACMALTLASSPSFAQPGPMPTTDHDHGQVQPAPTQPALPPDTHSEHDHGTAAAGSMGGMGGGMQGMGQMPMMEPTAANPFPHVEMKMHMAMMHAIGADATETYVRKMIEHHRGAVEMSRLILAGKPEGAVNRMATQSITDQNREIDALQAWLRQNGKTVQ